MSNTEISPVSQINSRWSCYNTQIAKDYGLDESIFVSYIWFGTNENSKDIPTVRDGRAWICDPMKSIRDKIGYWTVDQLRKIIKNCLKKKLIITSSYNVSRMDRTTWYSLTDMALDMCDGLDRALLADDCQAVKEG